MNKSEPCEEIKLADEELMPIAAIAQMCQPAITHNVKKNCSFLDNTDDIQDIDRLAGR